MCDPIQGWWFEFKILNCSEFRLLWGVEKNELIFAEQLRNIQSHTWVILTEMLLGSRFFNLNWGHGHLLWVPCLMVTPLCVVLWEAPGRLGRLPCCIHPGRRLHYALTEVQRCATAGHVCPAWRGSLFSASSLLSSASVMCSPANYSAHQLPSPGVSCVCIVIFSWGDKSKFQEFS